MASHTKKTRAEYPFLNWVGGKNRLIVHLMPYIPSHFDRYWEPFLGAGALFFALAPAQAIISDSNKHLIQCYLEVRDHPKRVAKYLAQHMRKHSKEHYYEVRDRFNASAISPRQAARFIYLNKACFNGIYRVNKDGKFNVPIGDKTTPSLPTSRYLNRLSQLLGKAEISHSSFQDIFGQITPGRRDFVYLDPPYPPLNGTAFFRHYTVDRFSMDDHANVAELGRLLDGRGSKVMISNANLPGIRELYSDWNIKVLPVTRWVAANGSREKVEELVITNYRIANGG